MNAELIDLGRRAVACKGWRWIPGMLTVHPHTGPVRVCVDENGEHHTELTVRPGPDGNHVSRAHDWALLGAFPRPVESDHQFIPDLSDPATIGCLLALVREAHPTGVIVSCGPRHGCVVEVIDGRWGAPGALAAPLVAALEAAP